MRKRKRLHKLINRFYYLNIPIHSLDIINSAKILGPCNKNTGHDFVVLEISMNLTICSRYLCLCPYSKYFWLLQFSRFLGRIFLSSSAYFDP